MLLFFILIEKCIFNIMRQNTQAQPEHKEDILIEFFFGKDTYKPFCELDYRSDFLIKTLCCSANLQDIFFILTCYS